jgi:hypothetical protein
MAPREALCYRPDCLQDRVRGQWECRHHLDNPAEPVAAHRALVSLYRRVCTLCSRGAYLELDRAQAAAARCERCLACGGRVFVEHDLGGAA